MTNLSDIQGAFGKNDAAKATALHTTISTMVDEGPSTLTASWDEVNAVADMSTHVVAPATGNVTLSAAVHGNRILYYDDADGVITLPAATGSGNKYTIILKTAFTSGTIVGLTNSATFLGGLVGVDTDSPAAYAWQCASGNNLISGSGTATGGKVGDMYVLVDIATNLYHVSGYIKQSGGSEVTPFSTAS